MKRVMYLLFALCVLVSMVVGQTAQGIQEVFAKTPTSPKMKVIWATEGSVDFEAQDGTVYHTMCDATWVLKSGVREASCRPVSVGEKLVMVVADDGGLLATTPQKSRSGMITTVYFVRATARNVSTTNSWVTPLVKSRYAFGHILNKTENVLYEGTYEQ